jgi:hypothetical protein
MSPFWRREVFTLFSAALIRGRRSSKKIDLKCGAHSGRRLIGGGGALNRVNTVHDYEMINAWSWETFINGEDILSRNFYQYCSSSNNSIGSDSSIQVKTRPG